MNKDNKFMSLIPSNFIKGKGKIPKITENCKKLGKNITLSFTQKKLIIFISNSVHPQPDILFVYYTF